MGGSYEPGWSIVVATVCIALIIPLLVVRHRPALRDEAPAEVPYVGTEDARIMNIHKYLNIMRKFVKLNQKNR